MLLGRATLLVLDGCSNNGGTKRRCVAGGRTHYIDEFCRPFGHSRNDVTQAELGRHDTDWHRTRRHSGNISAADSDGLIEQEYQEPQHRYRQQITAGPYFPGYRWTPPQ